VSVCECGWVGVCECGGCVVSGWLVCVSVCGVSVGGCVCV